MNVQKRGVGVLATFENVFLEGYQQLTDLLRAICNFNMLPETTIFFRNCGAFEKYNGYYSTWVLQIWGCSHVMSAKKGGPDPPSPLVSPKSEIGLLNSI